MRIVAISDTHGQHDKLVLPEGDILIHAGDISNAGYRPEAERFLAWFEKQDFTYKIFIPGNHDFFFERQPAKQIEKIIPKGITYLNDSGTEINGIKFWGSPVTPWFLNWAFNRHRGSNISRHWDLIPADTRVLITHGPMFGKLDTNTEGQHIGCKDLLHRAQKLNLKAHIFGHIHEAYGTVDEPGVKFINASLLNEKYQMVNKPIVFDLAS